MNISAAMARLKAGLPRKWFRDDDEVLDGILAGSSFVLGFVDDLIEYARRQTRLKTAEGGFLDLAAYDFFGLRFQRRANESDASFGPRIISEVLRPRDTRQAIDRALYELTGRHPEFFEAPRNGDAMGWNIASTGGYGIAGKWSSTQLPGQIFVTAYRPSSSGIPNVSGWSKVHGAFNPAAQNRFAWGDPDTIAGTVTDQDIIDAIESVRPAGLTIWMQIKS